MEYKFSGVKMIRTKCMKTQTPHSFYHMISFFVVEFIHSLGRIKLIRMKTSWLEVEVRGVEGPRIHLIRSDPRHGQTVSLCGLEVHCHQQGGRPSASLKIFLKELVGLSYSESRHLARSVGVFCPGA